MPDTYGLDCPLARTLDIIGERWAVLILRDLFLEGPRKFQDFESSLAGISPNTLSARLKRLEEGGIIERRFDQYDVVFHIHGNAVVRAAAEIPNAVRKAL